MEVHCHVTAQDNRIKYCKTEMDFFQAWQKVCYVWYIQENRRNKPCKINVRKQMKVSEKKINNIKFSNSDRAIKMKAGF